MPNSSVKLKLDFFFHFSVIWLKKKSSLLLSTARLQLLHISLSIYPFLCRLEVFLPSPWRALRYKSFHFFFKCGVMLSFPFECLWLLKWKAPGLFFFFLDWKSFFKSVPFDLWPVDCVWNGGSFKIWITQWMSVPWEMRRDWSSCVYWDHVQSRSIWTSPSELLNYRSALLRVDE